MNRKLKLANDFSDKTWSLTCAFISFLIIFNFVYIRPPTVSNKIQTDLGRSTRLYFFFQISINFFTCNQILFSFSLLHHSNGKGKQDTLKAIDGGFQERPKAGHVIALRSLHIPGWGLTQPVIIDLAVRMEHDQLTLL